MKKSMITNLLCIVLLGVVTTLATGCGKDECKTDTDCEKNYFCDTNENSSSYHTCIKIPDAQVAALNDGKSDS